MLLLSLAGCPLPEDEAEDKDTGDAPTTTPGITGLHEYFPQDGRRSATYHGEDGSILDVEKVATIDVGGVEVVTWRYWDDENFVADVRLASDEDGVRVYGWTHRSGDETTFDTPVRITPEDDSMAIGEVVTTETDGDTFTSELVGREDISLQWGLDWEGALRFRVDGPAGVWFVGEYWCVTRYGPGWMKVDGFFWDLADYDWEETEDTTTVDTD